ncbi:MAG: cytochrome c [Verrucomicrobiales bacterium]|nr:cytochrome c [Verrucomicrobiales bacterium]
MRPNRSPNQLTCSPSPSLFSSHSHSSSPPPALPVEQTAPRWPAISRGAWSTKKNCVFCHGRRGRGDGPWAKGVEEKPRDFRSGIFKFRSTPAGFLPTDDDLRRTVRTGISGTMMPAFKKLTTTALDAVIVYIKSLSTR